MMLNTNPTQSQLEEIKGWLVQEQQNTGSGFFCNWNRIEKSFDNKTLLSFEDNGKQIGFLSYDKYSEFVSEYSIFEIHPDYRRRNLGAYYFKKTEEYFQSIGTSVLRLFCAPEESESFWKKMGFIKFPYRGYSEPELTYYKPLVDVEEPKEGELQNKLELWNYEPYELAGKDNKNLKPKWTWEVGTNHKPIIQPCNSDWNLRLTLDGKIVKEDKVKYFTGKRNEIDTGAFLYINSILKIANNE